MKTNYILHLKSIYERFYEDNKLNATHISLYMALFQFWNTNRFTNPFFINRSDAMKLSKIGSKNTYHKCIRDLHKQKYIKYKPSNNPTKSSEVYMYNYDTTSGTSTETTSGTSSGVSTGILYKHINNIKHNKHINSKNQFSDFLQVEKNKDYNEPL
ncbi:hypothetical protein [Algibacter mikhailovii]|uniref:hypothetical protein n=1 Tax=Algibacter mikhailovii TaxID=425498 RepID=UPI002494BA71|nr:hypothetical protein [Algibacter mikhailovii]